MRRLETQQLGGFNDTPIEEPTKFEVVTSDGRTLDYAQVVANTPAVTGSYDAYNQPQLVLTTETGGNDRWDEDKYYPVGRLDDIHGRNLEVLAETVTIEDQFGNGYQSLCIKGSDFSSPRIMESETASRDFIIHGLQESLVMERVIRASQVLRAAGVETEYVCGLVIPERFPSGVNENGIEEQPCLPLPQLVESLATKYASVKATEQELDDNGQPQTKQKSAMELKAEMIEKLHDVDYLISYRAMDTPYRLGELSNVDKGEEFYDFLERNNDDPMVREYLENAHPVIYIADDLATNLAKNVARMHKAGISHGFLHSNNITALGSIVDLDSCRGEPLGLGDEPIGQADIYNDLRTSINSLLVVLRDMEPEDHREDPLRFHHLQDAKHFAAAIFLKNYLAERFDNPSDAASFAADLILDTYPKYKNDYGGFTRFCERITGGYRSYLYAQKDLPNITLKDLPNFSTYDMEFARKDSMLESVPARFFKEMRDKILSLDWTMNHEYEDLKDHERPAHSPTKAAVRSISLRLFCEHAQQTGFTDNAIGFLRALHFGASLENVDPRKIPENDNERAVHSYFVAQTQTIIDRLADEETQSDLPVMQFLLNMELGDLKDQTGHLAGENLNVPLLYLNGASQYNRVFTALGLKPDSPISYIDGSQAINATQEQPNDTILLVDYNIARFIAEQSSRKEVFLSIYGYWKDRAPLMLIQGLMSGSPHIYVAAHPELENYPLQTSAKQLASPNPRDWYPRLFNLETDQNPIN